MNNYMVKYNMWILAAMYAFLYICHLVYAFDTNGEINTYGSLVFHTYLLLIAISLVLFKKSSAGELQKKSLNRDRDTNLISTVLDIIGKFLIVSCTIYRQSLVTQNR